jgi:hypothetical protein
LANFYDSLAIQLGVEEEAPLSTLIHDTAKIDKVWVRVEKGELP